MTAIEVYFDKNAYKLDVIKKAAYRFTDVFSVDFHLDSSNIKCILSFSDKKSKELIDKTVSNFKNEVLDQDLREKISIETESVRNLILAHAFSRTSLIKE